MKTNNSNYSKKQLINEAFKFHSEGKVLEAKKSYQYCINQGFEDQRLFYNYGVLLSSLGKLQEAESLYRKAISINPGFVKPYYNLGSILKDLGKLQEAESMYRKAISINPDFVQAYYNLGLILKSLGKLQEAESSYRKAISINPDFVQAYYNLGSILKDLGKLQEAESSYRKAIEIKPNYAEAHSNLGLILKDLGKLQEAESSYRKAIEINPNFINAYFSLSLIKYSDENNTWRDKLFSENILNNKSKIEQVDLYFARANILHKEKKYGESSKYLKLANNLKLDTKPSKSDSLIKKSKQLLIESDKEDINPRQSKGIVESIFIVGMPRSGSTLLESILSMRDDVYDLGEVNILEESFFEYKKFKQEINLTKIYEDKVNNKTELNITTNKWLYNYQYAGIISRHIPNAKIIHCYRNPLDNILSIYRAHFAKGNQYSSSLVDCTQVYLDQEEIMTEYKNRYRSKIYDLNYDSLVLNSKEEIKSLISWLGWNWQDSFLTPHINPRSVLTRSNVEVRSPIHSKSSGGWKNYKDMLKPAIEILTQTDKYQDITS